MKVIVTTVGTSIFDNFKEYLINKGSRVPDEIRTLKDNTEYSEKDRIGVIRAIKNLEKLVTEWAGQFIQNGKKKEISAEFKSILEIYKLLQEQNKVYLLSTHTIISELACKIIKNLFDTKINEENIKIYFDEKQDVIEDLTIKDFDKFNQNGFVNLVNRIDTILSDDAYKNATKYLNITGGYKGITPILTLFGQIQKIDLNYIYEESSNLIEISGKLPINFDWEIIESFVNYLDDDNEYINNLKIRNNEIIKALLNLKLIYLTKDEDKKEIFAISSIGKLLRHYSFKENPLRNNVLGLYMEFKLYQFFSELEVYGTYDSEELNFLRYKNPFKEASFIITKNFCRTNGESFSENTQLYYSIENNIFEFKTNGRDNYKELGDIDLILENSSNKKAITEVKAAYLFSKKNVPEIGTEKDYYFKIQARIETFRLYYDRDILNEYLFIIHKPILPQDERPKDLTINTDLMKLLNHFKEKLADDYDEIKFKAIAYYIDLNERDYKVNYSKLLQKPLKPENWELLIG